MRNAFINTVLAGVVAFLAIPAFAYVAGTPVPTDSRIKTLVYNANDVYRVLTHYGYQMNIEFGKDEEIETISVGDRVGWQITPAEDRLFIRAMDDKSHTNMTVITNEHTYQFDLYSSKPGENGWDELVYVVRFFYPPEGNSQFASAKPATPMMASFSPPPAFSMSAPAPVMMAPPAMQMQQAPQMPPMSMMAPQIPQNACTATYADAASSVNDGSANSANVYDVTVTNGASFIFSGIATSFATADGFTANYGTSSYASAAS